MRKKISVPTLYPLDRDLKKQWFIKYFTPAGKPVKVYGKLARFATVKERESEAKRLLDTIQNPNFQPAGNVKTDLISLLDTLLEYKRPAMERHSYDSYLSIIKLFAVWYRTSCKRDAQTQPRDYARHLYGLNLHKNTVRNRINVLKGLAKELVAQGKLLANPFDGIKTKKVKASSKLPFTKEQADELKAAIQPTDPQLWLGIQFMYYLYLRPKEIRLLKVGDIIFSAMKVCLPGNIAKDDDTIFKTIPLPLRPAIAPLKHYPAGDYIFGKTGTPGPRLLGRDALSKRCKAFLTKLNYGHRYSFYSWCHTGIKNAALSGIPHKQLQLQKGHADLKMFDEYLKDLGIDDCVQLATKFPPL